MAWTLTAAVTYRKGNYVKFKIVCTSDGAAMAATDLLALSPGGTGSIVKSTTQTGRTMRDEVEGVTLMILKCVPAAAPAAAVPEAAWDFTLYDEESHAIYTSTDNALDANSWHDMNTDISAYPPLLDKLYLAFPTAADWDTGNIVDFYFIGWREERY